MEMCGKSFKISIIYYKDRYKAQLDYTKVCIAYNVVSNSIVLPESAVQTLNGKQVDSNFNTLIKVGILYEEKGYIINQTKFLDSPINAIALSPELFEYVYNLFEAKEQFALYIDDYANTDDVINELAKENILAISCFRSSVAGYDINKVVARYLNLTLSIVALIIINIVLILICYSILKTKKNDYVIFKMIGLSNKSIVKINYVETIIYGLFSNIILIILVLIIRYTANNVLILDMLKYIRFYDYLIILCITLISMYNISRLFNKYLLTKTKITVLKED